MLSYPMGSVPPGTTHFTGDKMIPISKYQSEIENGEIVFYAIISKTQKVRMPECYQEMYDNNHLAIEEVTRLYPELDSTPETHYIPLYTGDAQ